MSRVEKIVASVVKTRLKPASSQSSIEVSKAIGNINPYQAMEEAYGCSPVFSFVRSETCRRQDMDVRAVLGCPLPEDRKSTEESNKDSKCETASKNGNLSKETHSMVLLEHWPLSSFQPFCGRRDRR